MAGLDTLGDFYKTSGLAPGYVDAVKQGANLNSTIATTAQTQAQTDRYTRETPSFLRASEATARKGELGNMQEEANASAGVHGAKAGQSFQEAQLAAAEAENKFKNLPQKQQQEFITAIKKGQADLFGLVEQTLTQTNDVGQTISFIEQKYPKIMEDKGWAVAKQSVAGMPAQQAMEKIRAMKASLASSDSYGSSEQQGKMISQDQQDAAAMERTKYTADSAVQSAQLRAAGGGDAGPDTDTAVKTINYWTDVKYKAELRMNQLNTYATSRGKQGVAQELKDEYAKLKELVNEATKKLSPHMESYSRKPSPIPGLGDEEQFRGKGTPPPATATRTISAGDAMKLQQDPSQKMRDYFDQTYGPGSAAKVLGK